MSRSWISNQYCRRVTRLSTAYFTTLTIQAIFITQSVIFLLVNYLRGPEKYSHAYADLRMILRFDYLLPLFILQVFWLMSTVGCVYSIHRIVPCFMIPQLLTSVFLLLAAVTLLMLTIYHITKGVRLNSSLVLLLLLPSLYSFGALYSIYLTFSCFRLLVHKKKSVRNLTVNKMQKDALPGATSLEINAVSFSRRSTMIVNDDFLYIQPVNLSKENRK